MPTSGAVPARKAAATLNDQMIDAATSISHARRVFLKMTSPVIVTEDPPPLQSRLAGWYKDADLLDTFASPLPTVANTSIRGIAQAVLGQPVPAVQTLLTIRDGIARRLGLSLSHEPRGSQHGSDHIGIFPVLSAHEDELVLGKDNQLMDLRISLLIGKGRGGRDCVFATTAVRCHNMRGRAFIALVRPFHRIIIRASLYRAAKNGFAIESAPLRPVEPKAHP